MQSRIAQQECWGANRPHSVWSPRRPLPGLQTSSSSLRSDNTPIDFHRTSVWRRMQDLAQKLKKAFSAFKCRWLMSQKQWAEVWHYVWNWLKADILPLFLGLCADTSPRPEMLDPPWAHPTCHRTQLRHRNDLAKDWVQGFTQAAFYLCKYAKASASKFWLPLK